MSDFEMRAYALACSAYTGAAATPLPDDPPQAAGATSEGLETLIGRAREWNANRPPADPSKVEGATRHAEPTPELRAMYLGVKLNSSPRAPYGAMTTGEAEAWRTGWRVAQSAILDRVARQYPSLAAEIAGMRMPAPMVEPDGLCERGA